MRKNKLKTILFIANIALGVVIIFMFFAPFLTFVKGVDDKLLTFQLNGFSLLVNGAYALYIDVYDTIILKNVEFVLSIPVVLMFTCSIIALFIPLILLFIKKDEKVDKKVLPIHGFLSLISLIMSCIVLPTYPIDKFNFSMGYGLIILIILLSINLLISATNILLTYNIIKIKQD